MTGPKAVLFDLDDTLAESFKRPSDQMLGLLSRLLERVPTGIMTGASFQRMHEQFLPILEHVPHIERLYLFPTSAASCYVFRDGAWRIIYEISLSDEERTRIKKAIDDVVEGSDLLRSVRHFGEQMIDRGSQVAFTLVGFDATKEYKETWDIDYSKRTLLKAELDRRLPEFEILLGGRTTVDITKKGINKTYGIEWLSKELGIAPQQMLYIGDAFFEGGNDAIVIRSGIRTRQTSGPEETAHIIKELLSAL